MASSDKNDPRADLKFNGRVTDGQRQGTVSARGGAAGSRWVGVKWQDGSETTHVNEQRADLKAR